DEDDDGRENAERVMQVEDDALPRRAPLHADNLVRPPEDDPANGEEERGNRDRGHEVARAWAAEEGDMEAMKLARKARVPCGERARAEDATRVWIHEDLIGAGLRDVRPVV